MSDGVVFTSLQAQRIADETRTVEGRPRNSQLPQGAGPALHDSIVRWVKTTSATTQQITATDGQVYTVYPALLQFLIVVSGGGDVWQDYAACWLLAANGETPVLGRRYLGLLQAQEQVTSPGGQTYPGGLLFVMGC